MRPCPFLLFEHHWEPSSLPPRALSVKKTCEGNLSLVSELGMVELLQIHFPLKGCGSGDAHIRHYSQAQWCKMIGYDAQEVCGPGNLPGHSEVSCLCSPCLGSQLGVGTLCELIPLMLALAVTSVGAVGWNPCMWLFPVAWDSAYVVAGSLVWENP